MRRMFGENNWQLLHRKVKRKVYVYLIIFIIMAGISLYDVIAGNIAIALALIGWICGTLIGYLSGRAIKILWEEESAMIISKRDRKGIIILVVYLLFSLSRKYLLAFWFHGTLLTTFGFCIIAGARFARIFRLRRKIRQVLRGKGLIN